MGAVIKEKILIYTVEIRAKDLMLPKGRVHYFY